MTQHQHPLFSDPSWTEAWSAGQAVSSSLNGNHGTIVKVAVARYLLIRWALPSVHLCRHHSPLGLVKA